MSLEGDEGSREAVDPAPTDSVLGPEPLAAVPGLVFTAEPQRLSFSREQLRTSPDYHERRDAMPPRRTTGTHDAQLELWRLAV